MVNLLRSHFIKPTDICFAGEDTDEAILYIFKKSFFTNIDWLLGTIILLLIPALVSYIYSFAQPTEQALISLGFKLTLSGFWYLFVFGYIIYNFLNWFFNVYIITNKRIVDIDFNGLLYKNISEAPLQSVEDVTSNINTVIKTILNYGSVFIQTAAEKREFEFADVADPGKVRDLISDVITQLKSKRGADVA